MNMLTLWLEISKVIFCSLIFIEVKKRFSNKISKLFNHLEIYPTNRVEIYWKNYFKWTLLKGHHWKISWRMSFLMMFKNSSLMKRIVMNMDWGWSFWGKKKSKNKKKTVSNMELWIPKIPKSLYFLSLNIDDNKLY